MTTETEQFKAKLLLVKEVFTDMIEYAIKDDEPKAFMQCWLEGDWVTLENEWPGFDLTRSKEAHLLNL